MKTDNLTKQEAEQAMGRGQFVYHETQPDQLFKYSEGEIRVSDRGKNEGSILVLKSEWKNDAPETGWRIYQPETAQHTPLALYACIAEPRSTTLWEVMLRAGDKRDEHVVAKIFGNTKEEAESNARLIVKAVNNHDALVNIAEEAINGLKWLIEQHPTIANQSDYEKLEAWQAALNKVEQ